MGRELSEIDHLLQISAREMEQAITGKIMVIDEAIIALDLQTIIAEMGHGITGVAATHRDAVRLAARERPDLILSDIQLADGSSGIDAVNEILSVAKDIPVVFITAFPERLLTGERPEPAFVITKPSRKSRSARRSARRCSFPQPELSSPEATLAPRRHRGPRSGMAGAPIPSRSASRPLVGK